MAIRSFRHGSCNRLEDPAYRIVLPRPVKLTILPWSPSITSNHNRTEGQPRKSAASPEITSQPLKVPSHDDEDVGAVTELEDEDGRTPPPSHPLPAASMIQAPFDNFVHLPPPQKRAAAPPNPKPRLTLNQRGIRSRTLTSETVLPDQQVKQPKVDPAQPWTKSKQGRTSPLPCEIHTGCDIPSIPTSEEHSHPVRPSVKASIQRTRV